MDFSNIKTVLDIASFFIAIGVGVYTWAMSRDKATQTEIKELHTEKDEIKDRLTAIEKDIEYLPDRDSLHRTDLAIAEMKGDISTMAESFKGIARTVRLVDDFLRKGGNK